MQSNNPTKRVIGSPENHTKGIKIFNFTKEIVNITIDCITENYNAFLTHELTIREIFRNTLNDVDTKDTVDIIYESTTQLGNILLFTERAGLNIWLPPTITTFQKEQLVQLLKNIKVKEIDICLATSNPNQYKTFNYINKEKFLNLQETKEQIDKLKIDDNCTYLKRESKKYK